MRMQPRQQLLEIWNATVRSSWSEREKKWKFGGRDAPNSIGDAEQLLCILTPATKVEAFKLDRPDETAEDMIRALRPLGNATRKSPITLCWRAGGERPVVQAFLRTAREALAR